MAVATPGSTPTLRSAETGSPPSGTSRARTASHVIDATGLVVTPGFIDVHSHAAPSLDSRALAPAQPLLAQGITTIVGNPDGGGPVDLSKQRLDLQRNALGVNVALMIGHGSVRRAVLGMSDRDPTPGELDRMRTLVRQGMEAGAFGMSDGPFYAPASYSKTEEIIDLARIAGSYGGVYSSHIRDESDYTVRLVAAVDEVIRVARESHFPGIVTHIKALGPHVWGLGTYIVERIQQARAAGIPVYADQYPYDASGTSPSAGSCRDGRWSVVIRRSCVVLRIRATECGCATTWLRIWTVAGGPAGYSSAITTPITQSKGKHLLTSPVSATRIRSHSRSRFSPMGMPASPRST